jgi:hypothetical protein
MQVGGNAHEQWLIEHAIELYDGATGGAKSRSALNAAIPENCKVNVDEGGNEFVILYGRTVQGEERELATYEVVHRKPELRRVRGD